MGLVGSATHPPITWFNVSGRVNKIGSVSRFIESAVQDCSWSRARIMAHQARTSGQNRCLTSKRNSVKKTTVAHNRFLYALLLIKAGNNTNNLSALFG